MNPAVTLANAVVGRIHWKKVVPYCAAQMIGSIIASAVVYAVYYGIVFISLLFIAYKFEQMFEVLSFVFFLILYGFHGYIFRCSERV